MFLHPEHDAVAAVVRNIHVKEAVGIAGEQTKIKFPQPVGCFNKFGKMDIPGESEIHGVRFGALTSNPCALFA